MPSFFLNKYIIYILIGLGLMIFTGGAYLVWKHQVEQAALAEFNKEQLEKVIKNQEENLVLMKNLSETQDRIITEMATKNAELNNKLGGIEEYLLSPEVDKDNRESSDVLKKTIERLSK